MVLSWPASLIRRYMPGCIGMIDAGFWSLTGNTIKVVPEKITGSIGQRGIV